MPDPIPDEAVEAVARVLCSYYGQDPDTVMPGGIGQRWRINVPAARAILTAAAPHIAAQAVADLRAGIEALRDEWRRLADEQDSYAAGVGAAEDIPATDALAALTVEQVAFSLRANADALDTLLRGASPMSTWLHARWFEPHPAVPVEGSQHYTRWGALEAECATCGEALVSAVIRTSPERAR